MVLVARHAYGAMSPDCPFRQTLLGRERSAAGAGLARREAQPPQRTAGVQQSGLKNLFRKLQCERMRLRILIPVTVLLIFGALIGFLQAAAKDDTTTTEAIIFWLSVVAMPFLLLALLVFAGVGIWRAVRRFWLPRQQHQQPGSAQS